MQRVLDRFRHIAVHILRRHHQLIRKRPRLRDGLRVTQQRRHMIHIARDVKNAMTLERVQVLPHHLPGALPRDTRPMLRGQRQLRQHLERYVRHLTFAGLLERDPLLHRFRQQGQITRATNDPGKERLPLGRSRFRVHHPDHIRQRRVITDIGVEQRPVRRFVQPILNHRFRRRTKRFTTRLTGTDDLHKIAQHLAVIDHTGKHRPEQNRVAPRQDRQQYRRHILHVPRPARIDRCLSQETRVNRLGHLQNIFQLFLWLLIKHAPERAGHCQLRQGMRIGISVGRRRFGVCCSCFRQQPAFHRCKHGFVRHCLVLI